MVNNKMVQKRHDRDILRDSICMRPRSQSVCLFGTLLIIFAAFLSISEIFYLKLNIFETMKNTVYPESTTDCQNEIAHNDRPVFVFTFLIATQRCQHLFWSF